MRNRENFAHPAQVKKDTPGKECPFLCKFTFYIILQKIGCFSMIEYEFCLNREFFEI